MSRVLIGLLAPHFLLWITLAILAYANAGPFTFASCWPLLLVYLPSAALALGVVAGGSLIVQLICIARPKMRDGLAFAVSAHVIIFIVGLSACSFAARLATGPVSCL